MGDGRWYPTNTSLLDGKVLVTAGLADECDGNRQNNIPDLWQNGTWFRLFGAYRELPLYPMMFAASNGKVFCVGPNVDTGYLDPTGIGAWTMTGNTRWATAWAAPPAPACKTAAAMSARP